MKLFLNIQAKLDFNITNATIKNVHCIFEQKQSKDID